MEGDAYGDVFFRKVRKIDEYLLSLRVGWLLCMVLDGVRFFFCLFEVVVLWFMLLLIYIFFCVCSCGCALMLAMCVDEEVAEVALILWR